MTLPPLLSPLRNDLYRAVWCAMLLSYFGVWIQSVGAAWLMTTIAPTVDFVAWVQAANAIPPILFTVFGGVLADRFDQRLILNLLPDRDPVDGVDHRRLRLFRHHHAVASVDPHLRAR